MARPLPSIRARLRFRLGFALLGLAVATFLLVDGLAGALLRETSERQLGQAALHLAERLDEDLEDVFRDLLLAADAAEIRSAVAGGDPPAARERLERSLLHLPRYAWLGLAAPDGRVIAGTGGHLVGLPAADRTWFARGRSALTIVDVHEALLLKALLLPDSPEPLRFIDVAAPVASGAGGPPGVVVGHLGLGWAESVARAVTRSVSHLDGLEMLVLSEGGEILIGPQALVGTPFDVRGDAARYVSVEAGPAAATPFPRLGWRVVGRQPRAAALAPIQRFRVLAFGGLAALALVVLIGAEHLVRSVSRPFEALARSVGAWRTRPDVPLRLLPATTREAGALNAAVVDAVAAMRGQEAEARAAREDGERRAEARLGAMRDAKDEAEAASAAKTEFLATMSHEIRSPLGSIAGLTDLLLEDPAIAGRQRRRLALIRSATAGLTALVHDLLDLSRIESGGFAIAAAPFRLPRLVETCTAMMEAEAARRGVAVTLHLAVGLPAVLVGDENRLRQVLINLLGNAVTCTREGRVTLRVTRATGADGRAAIRFEVEDTGIGIAPDTLAGPFRRDEQADGAIPGEFGGPGLGLAISRRFVALMGGAITVRSEPGRGSAFAFAIPLVEPATRIEESRTAA